MNGGARQLLHATHHLDWLDSLLSLRTAVITRRHRARIADDCQSLIPRRATHAWNRPHNKSCQNLSVLDRAVRMSREGYTLCESQSRMTWPALRFKQS
jgi:hypothetical protein